MAAGNRPARVGAEIQKLLAALFAKGLKDPRIGFVTFTGVDVSPDLREARVWWTTHGTDAEQKATAKGLDAARGYLRREVGRSLGLRVTPDLHFKYDVAIDRGQRIEELLREVKREDQARQDDPKSDPKQEQKPGDRE